MILYHGSNHSFTRILSARECGNINKGEPQRTAFTDVVFLTTSFSMACSYGKYVYVIEVEDPQVYADLLKGKKAMSVSREIFVAPSNRCRVLARYIKEGRRHGGFFYECLV
jgi:hypothetical protein